MKANNTTKRVKTIEEINAQAERLMQANETWYQDATRANREPINRKAQIIAAWHNTKAAAKEIQNNNTPATMNEANESKKMYTDYKTAVNWLNNSLILCNNIVEVDPSVIDNARFSWYDEDTERDTEIFQWFITDCSEDDVEFLESRFPGLLFSYSDMLDVFVLCVDHFGTAWSGVSIETTLENAAKENI